MHSKDELLKLICHAHKCRDMQGLPEISVSHDIKGTESLVAIAQTLSLHSQLLHPDLLAVSTPAKP